jgi:1-acyl-sn-glycerol-3-phosphate acyltransferase
MRQRRAQLSRPRPPPKENLTVHIVRAMNVCFARIYHRLEVVSSCRLPRTGPAILACNHTSGLDPALIQSACRRDIIWMMAREYYEQPALRWFFKLVRAIPVDRSGQDMSATRQAMRALNSGYVLGIFPEGKIETDRHSLLPFQTGVAMMALKTGVEVYPAYLEGSQRGRSMLEACLQSQSAKIAFGHRVDLSAFDLPGRRPDHQGATKVLEEKILDLRQLLDLKALGSNP